MCNDRTTTRTRFALSFVFMALAFCFSLTAQAQFSTLKPLYQDSWGGWENLGNTTLFGPECISTKSDRIDCFTIGFGAAISRMSWNGSAWSNWQPVAGVIPSNYVGNLIIPLRLECVSWGADHIDCFVRGDNGTLLRRTWDGAYDHGWQNLGGIISSAPDCVSTEPRRIDCFARASTGGLRHISFNGDTWGNWVTYPGDIAEGTKPECVAYIGGRIECVAMWPDYSLRHFSVRNPLRGFQMITLPAVAMLSSHSHVPRTPVCRTEPNTTTLACFSPWSVTIPSDGRLVESFGMWTYDINSDQWGFTDLASDFGQSYFSQPTGRMNYDFDCVARSGGRFDCMELVARQPLPISNLGSRTLLLRQVSLSQGTSSGWRNFSLAAAAQPIPSTLACNSWGGDRLDCFAAGAGFDASPLWHTWLVPGRVPIFKGFFGG